MSRLFVAGCTLRGDGKRFVVRADEMLTAFLELESAIRATYTSYTKESGDEYSNGSVIFVPDAHRA